MLDDDGDDLLNVDRMKLQKLAQRLCRFLLWDIGIALDALHQTEEALVGDIVLQHVEDETFFDGLAHRILMERRDSARPRLVEHQLCLEFRRRGEGKEAEVWLSRPLHHFLSELCLRLLRKIAIFFVARLIGDGIRDSILIQDALVRQDEPPRVTLIDFKSGDPNSDNHQKLDEREMKLQVAIYAVGAKKELEYQPEKGMVRYLGVDKDAPHEKRELEIPLDDKSILEAKALVAQTARSIRDRHFHAGPVLSESGAPRCPGCDFLGLCGMKEAAGYKKAAGKR